MSSPIASSLLDGVVLAVVERESTYGYRITQDVQQVLDISESTLYPVLRRLQKDGCLTTYLEGVKAETIDDKPPLLPHHRSWTRAAAPAPDRLAKLPQRHRHDLFWRMKR